MILKSPLLAQLDWLEHGFGTRSAELSQDAMASLKQIHSASVLLAETAGTAGPGDALVTHTARLPVSVRTADCYPVLLADTKNHAVAAVHAGWRGTAAGIVTQTIAKMHAEFGTEAADIFAGIGPGIGKCCYEVGADVARLFGVNGASHVDLAESNRRQLADAGVQNIDIMGVCTF